MVSPKKKSTPTKAANKRPATKKLPPASSKEEKFQPGLMTFAVSAAAVSLLFLISIVTAT